MSLLSSRTEEESRVIPFFLDVLRYPLTKSGIPILIVGVILLLASNFASILPLIGLFALLFIFAYLSGLYFELIHLSATGQDEIYCFPDLSDMIEDIVRPGFQVLGVFLISFAPLIAFAIWGDEASLYYGEIELGLTAWAAFYFPMAMLATVLFGTIRGALPHVVLPAIFRSGPLYLVAIILTFGLACAQLFVPEVLSSSIWIGSIVTALVSMFTLMASARTLGLLYLRREEELAWF